MYMEILHHLGVNTDQSLRSKLLSRFSFPSVQHPSLRAVEWVTLLRFLFGMHSY